ncbi:MAG: hypothetical protein ABSF92_08675 [Candidatus Acidiferrales bacterium]|jgi:hypothetical protein
MMLPRPFYKHLFPALLVGLGLRLFFVWRFPFASGDTPYYEELARNWLYHGVYGFFSNGLLYPSDARMPGYPGFLAVIYSLAGPGRNAVFVAQAFVDLATCVLTVCIAARLAAGASEPIRRRITIAALWLAVLCPFTANYAAVPLTEVLTTFLTTLAILIFLLPSAYEPGLIQERSDLLRSVRIWFLAGLVVGLGTLVRPETPLLLAAILLVYWLRWWRPLNWRKLTVATLWVTVGLLLPLAPWAARNAHALGRVQFLAPRYAETFGVVMPTGFYAWTKTWMFRFRDAYLLTWKLPVDPIALNDLPAYAFDSPEERSRVASLLERYNRERRMTGQMDAEFARLARERTRRHPFRSYAWIPIERAAAMWFTPRITLLPYSGKIWPPSDGWHQSPTGFETTLGFALLNFLYAGLALLGAVHWRASPGIALIVAFIVIRTAFLTQLQTCEPRYVLVCFPALLALGAQSWRSRPWKLAPTAMSSVSSVRLSPALPACRDREMR